MNNRQNGRRRGRGGQQARQPGGPNNGSRVDNRARGNAAQLLEKYKTLARDAQMQGDRVNTEYYLQFADHYFRVLSENRARFEEQRPRPQNDARDDFGGEDDAAEFGQSNADQGDDGWDEGDAPAPEQPQRSFTPRQERGNQDRNGADRNGQDRSGPERNRQERPGEPRRERGRRNGQANGHVTASEAPAEVTEDADNAAFAPDFMAQRIEAQPANPTLVEDVAEAEAPVVEEEAPKPRRRTRRPRAEAVADA